MPKAVKALAFFTLFFFFSAQLNAQLKLPAISPTVNDIKKVLHEYPNHFTALLGELIRENEQSVDYECTLQIDGAEEAYITKFPSTANISSWQATLITTEDYSKAKQKYKLLCSQLKNLHVAIANINYKIKGEMPPLTEEMKFASTEFTLSPSIETTNKLKIEVAIQFNMPMEWKVKVLIYDKEREDDEKGSAKD